MKGQAIKYTDAELGYIKENGTLPRKKLTERFNAKFRRDLRVSSIASLCKRNGWLTGRTGTFEKGHIPFSANTKGVMKVNSGSFKKGNLPHNHKPVGSSRVNVEGYIEVKVEEPNKWQLKHRVMWQRANGKIPRGFNLLFKDHNKQNCAIENLLLVRDAENLYMNRTGLNTLKGDSKETAKHIATMNVTLHERLKV